jgi:hypothetical protein
MVIKMFIPKIWSHKKFQAGIITTLTLLLAHLGPALEVSTTFLRAVGSISPTEWLIIIGPILTAIGVQGLADIGKEAAKIDNGQTDSIKKLAGLKEEPVDQTQ